MPESSYGHGYDGRLSNSMVQTAQFCTHRFKRLYAGMTMTADTASDTAPAVIIDARSLGVLVHGALEHILAGDSIVLEAFFKSAAEMTGLAEEDLRRAAMRHASAIDATQASGSRYGTKYSAPEMTNYWKQNFTDVDAEWARLQALSADSFQAAGRQVSWGIGLAELVGVGYACVQAELRSRCWSSDGVQVWLEKVIFGDVFGVPMAGTLDVLLYSTAGATGDRPQLKIIDYKTGRKKWTISDVQNSDQFCLYRYMLRAEYPSAEIQVGVRDLRHDEYIEVPVDAVAMASWENRYEPKALFTQTILGLGESAEEVVIPYGSGFSPGCPCEFTSTCPYTSDFTVV